MTIVNTVTATLSPEKATEIMSAMITAGTFNPETYKAACEAYLAVITPPAAPEAVKKERKQRAPNKPGSQQGWAGGVTREEYNNWLATLTADYTGKRNSYAYRDIRDNVTAGDPVVSTAGDDNIMAGSGNDNSNEAVNPPSPPSIEEVLGVNDEVEVDNDLAAIVAAEEEKHAVSVLAGNVKPGVSKKNKKTA